MFLTYTLIAFSLLYMYQPVVGNFDSGSVTISGLKNNTNIIVKKTKKNGKKKTS